VKKTAFWLFIIVILISISCQKYQLDDVKLKPWTPELAAPLVNSTFGVVDIFDHGGDAYLQVDENGLLGIVYSGTIFSLAIDDIISVGSNDLEIDISYPDPGFPVAVIDTINDSKVFEVEFDAEDADNVEVHELAILNGFMQIVAASELAFDTKVIITVPHAIKNGMPFKEEVVLLPGEIKEQDFDLSGYLLDLTQEDQGFNQILFDFETIISYDPDVPAGDGQILIKASLDSIGIDFITGYFGQNMVAVDTDTIEIDLFDNTLSGQFQFIDPNLKFIIINSFGLPVLIDITEFKSENIDGTETNINLPGITDGPFIAEYPTVLGESKTVKYEFNNQNSNIEDILNNGTKKIIWGLNAISNPDGPTPDLNFITHESELEIQTDITIPLKGYAWDWVFTDTLEINIDESPDEIKKLTLRLILDNGFPAGGDVQVYMTDSAFQLTDSLFSSPAPILVSGEIDPEGNVIQSTKAITDIVLEGESITHLTEATHLIIFTGMETTDGSPPDNQVIQIKDDYTLVFKLSLKAIISVNPDGL
jgi:hypothetical protein